MAAPTRIWCVGDSLTQGSISGTLADPGGGYRKPLRDRLFASGYSFLMVGTLTGGELPPLQHDGHNGYTIEMLRAGLVTWQEAAIPDLVCLLAGTNNIVQAGTKVEYRQGAEQGLLGLVNDIRDGRGTPAVIVSAIPPADPAVQPTLLQDTTALITRTNSRTLSRITTMASAGLPVSFVDGGLTTSDLSDGIHLNASGYAKLMDAFGDAVDAYLAGL